MNEDEILGKLITKADLLSNTFDKQGEILLYENGFKIEFEGRQSKAPYDYIQNMTKTGEGALGKIKAKISVFDMLGINNEYEISIPDQIYNVLKRRWEESK
ncbi:hypothetical protein KO317_04295 [Candidatus Micrarchaeota archaeon]|nr:hypothetical protein [Candidatus Micrarchaeota archaeon]